MKIVSLQSQDIPECRDIYNHYIRHTCFTLEETELELEAFASRVQRITRDYPFLVAKDDKGHILGYAYLFVFNERSAYRRTADVSIYIHKDHLHEHLGSLLYASLESLAKKQGLTNLISIITSENPVSCRFHETMGFVREAHLKNVAFKMDHLIDVFYYRKSLQ